MATAVMSPSFFGLKAATLPALQVEVRVCGLGGEVCRISAVTSWNLFHVKNAIEHAAGIPVLEQRLLWGCVELRDADMLVSDNLLPKQEPWQHIRPLAGAAIELSLLRRSPEQVEWLHRAASDDDVFLHFQFAPEHIRADREVVLAFLPMHTDVLENVAEALLGDHAFMLEAVLRDGFALEYATENLKDDHELVLAAVRTHGWALQYASERLRADREVVLAAVGCDGCALEVASEALRADRAVVRVAIKNDGLALGAAASELVDDPELQQLAARKLRNMKIKF